MDFQVRKCFDDRAAEEEAETRYLRVVLEMKVFARIVRCKVAIQIALECLPDNVVRSFCPSLVVNMQ